MARKNLTEVVNEQNSRGTNLSKLASLVKNWGKNKTDADRLKKDVDKDAAQIKQIMLEENLTESESEEYIAKLSFQEKEKLDEDGLLRYIKSVLWADKGSMMCPYIKTVETIDFEALEKDMYTGVITKEQMLDIDKFRTIDKVPMLRLDKVK